MATEAESFDWEAFARRIIAATVVDVKDPYETNIIIFEGSAADLSREDCDRIFAIWNEEAGL